MKKFSCGDIVPDCQHDFAADSDDELMAQVRVHAANEHGIAEVPTELESQIRSLIVAA